MNSAERKAVDAHQQDICRGLASHDDIFLSFLCARRLFSPSERQLVERKATAFDRLLVTFDILKVKDGGWVATMRFLEENQLSWLANQLKKSAGERVEVGWDFPLDEFISNVANFYLSHYGRVETLDGSERQLNEVWRPVAIEMRSDPKPIDIGEVLKRLHEGQRNIGVLSGEVASGKTILAMKVGLDWATKRAAGQDDPFQLVLIVPLRCVAVGADSFLSLAVDYFVRQLELKNIDTAALLAAVGRLGSRLLVCLDGLDSYGSWRESPLVRVFGDPFQRSPDNCKSPAPYVTFKMLITSRPYACRSISVDFCPLLFQLCPVGGIRFDQLLHRLNNNSETDRHSMLKDLGKVPLLLTHLWLESTTAPLSTDLTRLFGQLFAAAIGREQKEKNLRQTVELADWKSSKLVRSLARLAFWGLEEEKTNFSMAELERIDVSQDAFVCGFLVYEIFREGVERRRDAKFCCPSVMEFFAAVHCRQSRPQRDVVMREVCRPLSRLGQFLFGLASAERKFDSLLDWLQPSLGDLLAVPPPGSLENLLSRLSAALSDCENESDCRLLGQRLASTVGLVEEEIVSATRTQVWWSAGVPHPPMELRPALAESLRLQKDSANSWSLRRPGQICDELMVVAAIRPPPTAPIGLSSSVCVWLWDGAAPKDFDRINFSPVGTMVIRASPVCMVEVVSRLSYKQRQTTPLLKHLSFACSPAQAAALKLAVGDAKSDWLVTKSSQTSRANDQSITRLHVKVVQTAVDHSDLIRALIRLSLSSCESSLD